MKYIKTFEIFYIKYDHQLSDYNYDIGDIIVYIGDAEFIHDLSRMFNNDKYYIKKYKKFKILEIEIINNEIDNKKYIKYNSKILIEDIISKRKILIEYKEFENFIPELEYDVKNFNL